MKMNWQINKFFRNAEGEGDGGAGGSLPEGASPSPETTKDDTIANLTARLDRLNQSVDAQTADSVQRNQRSQVIARDNELNNVKAQAQANVDTLEKALADAYDNGEGGEIAKAQRALTQGVAKVERADLEVETFRKQVKAAEARAPAGGDLDETNLNSWKSKHSTWYGVDAAMTKASHEIDRQIREAGVISAGSTAYFEAVDRQMSQKFPERFGGTPSTNGGTGGGGGGAPNPNKGRIASSIADGWRRMGIDMSDPKVVERMNKNRQTAVDKGILNQTPSTGSIITR